MSSRQGGKLKPLKAPKKEKNEETEEDIAFKEKKKAEAAAMKAAKDKALKSELSARMGAVVTDDLLARWPDGWQRDQEVWEEVADK